MLTYHKTTEEEKEIITAWQYAGQYAIYNTTPYAEQKKQGVGFANPKNNFYSFFDHDTLVGFINLYEEPTEVFFGIGVRPDACGRGYGQQMTKAACDLSGRLFPGSRSIWRSERGMPELSGAMKKRVSASQASRFARRPRRATVYFIIWFGKFKRILCMTSACRGFLSDGASAVRAERGERLFELFKRLLFNARYIAPADATAGGNFALRLRRTI